MNSQNDHPMDPADLHQKAEGLAMERTAGSSEVSADLSAEEMRKTIHELRLQQIELERQNEELRTGQTQVMAEESLSEQRDFSESLIETAQTIILVLDTQGRIVRFNPYMEQLVGYALDEVRGMDWFETFIKLENNDAIKSVFIKTVDNIQTSGTVNSIITKDGRTVLVEWSNKTLKDKYGRTVGVLAIGQDITERKQAEEALKLERDSTRNILATVDAMIIALGPEGRITLVNRKACEILGYREDELLGHDWFATCLPHSIDVDQVRAVFKMALAGNLAGSEYYENPVRTRSGEERLIAWHNSSIRDKDGNIIGGLSAGMDITERKLVESRLSESETKHRQLIENTHDIIYSLTPEGVFTYVSPAWKILLGHLVTEVEGHLFTEFVHPDDHPVGFMFLQKVLAGQRQEGVEYRIRHINGEWRWHTSSATPTKDTDGLVIGYEGIARDITKRKQAQLALEQKKQEMEQLIYSVSHDLKSPLVTVKTFAGMLRQDIQDGNQQQITENLKYIDSSTDKMQQLLDALLQYSRIGTVDAPAQTLSANHLVQNCLATLAGILRQHQVQVSTDDLPHQLHGDPLHFGQIWQNLIENAVKYRGDQPQPHIEIGATQEGHDVVFYVRDNGMGIAPEHNERIFNLFSQLQPGSDGSGLGLALVKKIVSVYQGRIWVESDGKGKGSCFYFTLPGALVKEDTSE